MLFRERRREKNGKRKSSQICKDARGGDVCMYMCENVYVCVTGQPSQGDMLWPDMV